jgi:hypothetical protein
MAKRNRNNNAQRQREHMLALIEYQQGLIELLALMRKLLSEFYRR